MTQSAQKDDLLVEFLTELADQLLRLGLGAPEFLSVMQLSFIRAASRDARLRNARLNQSAIAAKTGLSRPQVSALMKRKDVEADIQNSHLSNLMSGWVSDPDFAANNGTPRALTIKGADKSFQALVRKYGADVTHKALLKELLDRQLARVRNDKVCLTSQAIASVAKKKQFERLCGVLATAMRPPGSGEFVMKSFSREVEFPSLDSVSRLILRRRLKQGFDVFHEDMEGAVAALSEKRSSKSRRDRRSKISLLVVSHE